MYNAVSQRASYILTTTYSTSFSMAIRLLPSELRPHICNMYGLVRVADEIVDTYRGPDRRQLLDALEQETYETIGRGYSTNMLVHAFALTARHYSISTQVIKPFFASMRADISKQTYSAKEYRTYIHGSAEVVGLMCLAVFCRGDKALYELLKPGAQALGSAFQKVNFLRDVAADNQALGRMYFPGIAFTSLDNEAKQAIIADIRADFAHARQTIALLPADCRPAVSTAYRYYELLLNKLERTPITVLKQRRLRVSNGRKAALYAGAAVKRTLPSRP